MTQDRPELHSTRQKDLTSDCFSCHRHFQNPERHTEDREYEDYTSLWCFLF